MRCAASADPRSAKVCSTSAGGAPISTSDPAAAPAPPFGAVPIPGPPPADATPPPSSQVASPPAPVEQVTPPSRPRRRLGWIIAVAALSVALLAALAVLVLSLIRLAEARTVIDDQEDVIDEQRELIEKKEAFAAAMAGLGETADRFEGVLFGSIVPQGRYDSFEIRAYNERWNGTALDALTAEVREAAEELAGVLTTAQSQAAANGSGSTYEAVIDQLGGGFVTAVIDDADTLCEDDVLGCVISDDPYTVHFDAADNGAPWMTDWLRTGIAYHEFAHVLQMTNPEPTREALQAFGGDDEIMADCFALTYLDGWELDHRIWVSDVEYWDVSVGYGHVCDEGQRQAVRDWYARLGVHRAPAS